MTVLLDGSRPAPDQRWTRGQSVSLDVQHPWPGLPAYDEASSAFFRGRGEEAVELLRLIRTAPLTTVYGKSGLGKTSLLQAGLFPLLRAEHYLPVYLLLDFSESAAERPLVQVMRRLQEQFDAVEADYPTPDEGESVWEYLHRRDLDIWSHDNYPLTPVLVFDQFEELFSRSGASAETIKEIFDNLADLIENRIPGHLASGTATARRSQLDLLSQRYRIVLSFREDFLPDVSTWEKQVPSLLHHYLRLEPMSRRCAIDAVEQAGAAVLEPGVAASIVDLVGASDRATDAARSEKPIEPVLLSLCCYQLNRRRKDGKPIDNTLVDEAGQDILDSFYRDALGDPDVQGPPDASLFIENHLIQGDHFRGDYPRDEALAENKINKRQLSALTDRHRLLRTVHHADTARVELIHDRLVPVVRKARDERRLRAHQEEQEQLAREAQEERDRERHRNEELQKQRDVATRNFKVATRMRNVAAIAALAALAAGGWVVSNLTELQERERQLQERNQTAEVMSISEKTSHLAAGRLSLAVGSEPLEQIIYRGLAAFRLAGNELRQARAASLLALHAAMEVSGHLRRVVKIPGLVPTPALAYSPDGKMIAAGGEDGIIRLLDSNTYAELGRLDCQQEAPESAWALGFNADGKRLAAGHYAPDGVTGTGLVCIFDVAGRSIVRKWMPSQRPGEEINVYSLAYGESAGREVVLFGGSDGVVRLLDVQSGSVRERSHEGEVTGVAMTRDGRFAATGGADGALSLWDLGVFDRPNSRPIRIEGHDSTIQQLAFSPSDQSVLLSASDDGRVRVWNWNPRGICLAQQTAVQTTKIYGIAVSVDDMIAAAGADGNLRLFRLEDRKCTPRPGTANTAAATVPEFGLVEDGMLGGHGGYVLGVAFNSDGRRILSTGSDGSVRVWGPKTGGFSLAQLERTQVSGLFTTIAISPDQKFIAAGDGFGVIYVWEPPRDNVESLRQNPTLHWEAGDGITALSFTRMGDQLVLLSANNVGVIKRWDPARGEAIGGVMALDGKDQPIQSMAVSPDGRKVAAGGEDGNVHLWDTASGMHLQTIARPDDAEDDYQVVSVGFSRDGNHLAIGTSRDLLKIVNLAKPDDVRLLQGHTNNVTSFAHNEARWLISAGLDGTVLEWQEGALSHPPQPGLRKVDEFESRLGYGESMKPLTSMSANAAGLILTGGEGGLVQLWDWDGREHILIGPRFLAYGDDPLTGVALAPDGSFFVTESPTTILLWPGPARWADILCSKLSWNMSEAEWRKWVSSDLPYREQCPGLKTAPSEFK